MEANGECGRDQREKMTEEGKQHHHHGHQPQPTAPPAQQYGTFHGVPGYSPPTSQTAIGFPPPPPPRSGAIVPLAGAGPTCCAHGYQAIPVQAYIAVNVDQGPPALQ